MQDCTSEKDGSCDEERRVYRHTDRPSGDPELVVSKRSFRHARHQTVFTADNGKWVSAKMLKNVLGSEMCIS